MTENEISSLVIGAAIEVHKELGPGLFESVYEACLYYELLQLGLKVERQVTLPVDYKSNTLDVGFRVDLIVEEKVILELKAIQEFHPIYTAQIMTYLKLSDLGLGLLINFNKYRIKDGLKRVVNNL